MIFNIFDIYFVIDLTLLSQIAVNHQAEQQRKLFMFNFLFWQQYINDRMVAVGRTSNSLPGIKLSKLVGYRPVPDVMHQGSESQLLNVVFWYLIDMTKHGHHHISFDTVSHSGVRIIEYFT